MAKKAKTTTTNKDETKSQKFERLAILRVNNALTKIELVGNLSSTAYEYTPEQVAHIRKTLTATVNTVMDGFNPKTAKAESKFSF